MSVMRKFARCMREREKEKEIVGYVIDNFLFLFYTITTPLGGVMYLRSNIKTNDSFLKNSENKRIFW